LELAERHHQPILPNLYRDIQEELQFLTLSLAPEVAVAVDKTAHVAAMMVAPEVQLAAGAL
jgi:hypothetical protein